MDEVGGSRLNLPITARRNGVEIASLDTDVIGLETKYASHRGDRRLSNVRSGTHSTNCPPWITNPAIEAKRTHLGETQLRRFGFIFSARTYAARILEGVLHALRDEAPDPLEELAVGERCGITVPTRYAFRGANYYDVARRVGDVRMHHFDETPQVQIPLYHPERLRSSFYTPAPVAQADFFVNCPKFKAHPWTTVTFSMKNYIGIQDDRHRLIDHDHRLNEKVADLQYIVQPQFIAMDAITAGEGRMLTPLPRDLGLVLMGNNQVAFDAVCCHLIGVDPMSVEHIRLAHERGFGPVDLAEINIVGGVSLEAARERGQGFQVGLIRVEDYFNGSRIRAYGGRPPSDGNQD